MRECRGQPERLRYNSPGHRSGTVGVWLPVPCRGETMLFDVRLSRPFRAALRRIYSTQGDALGWYIRAFQAQRLQRTRTPELADGINWDLRCGVCVVGRSRLRRRIMREVGFPWGRLTWSQTPRPRHPGENVVGCGLLFRHEFESC